VKVEVSVLASLAEIPAQDWDDLAGGQPFLRHAFLHGLELSGCVGPGTGWEPAHLALRCDDEWVACVPLYRKDHSFGEYVFDWAWARAYEQHGLAYYPKLLCAVPFTPVAGPRLLVRETKWLASVVSALAEVRRQFQASSLHVLFPGEDEREALQAGGALLRQGVQFHWNNAGYADFEAFLATLARDKRKKIRQERRRVADAGVVLRRVRGPEIDADLWQFFTRCYRNTYRQHGSSPYLNAAFFRHLGSTLPEHVLMVVAERDGRQIAAALDLHDGERLWGRHWGALEHVPGLHFEACYYQGIEFCIEQGLQIFEGGAQGEHKLARGFLPVTTWSAHQIADRRFAAAIEEFLEREGEGISHYVSELEEHAPYRPAPASPGA
jgi:predicted N-acyltransferase